MKLSMRNTGAFSPATMIIVVLVGIVAMAGFALLSAYAPELRSGDNGGEHALSRSATGYGALPQLLRGVGQPVVLSRGPTSQTAAGSLLVLTPSISTDAEKIAEVEHIGPTLIVLPKWATRPHPLKRGWIQSVGVERPAEVLRILPPALRRETNLAQLDGRGTVYLSRPGGQAFGRAIAVDQLQTLSGPGWVPVVVDSRGRSILAMHGRTRLYVLADPDFISTHGLKTLDGARTAVDLLQVIRAPQAPVIFDLTLHGFERSRNLLRLILEPPLLGMTLVMVALAAFAGYQAAVRFGPPREKSRAIALGKGALAENTAALVRLAKREHHMAAPYALLVRAAVARSIGAPRNLSDDALNAFLDRVSKIMGASDTYSALAEQARAAKTPGDLMQVAASLHRWNQELTRASQ